MSIIFREKIGIWFVMNWIFPSNSDLTLMFTPHFPMPTLLHNHSDLTPTLLRCYSAFSHTNLALFCSDVSDVFLFSDSLVFRELLLHCVKETYGRKIECTEDGWDGRIGATKYAGGNGTRKRGGKAEHITQGWKTWPQLMCCALASRNVGVFQFTNGKGFTERWRDRELFCERCGNG